MTPQRFDSRLQLIAGPQQIRKLGAEGVANIAAEGGATWVQLRDKTSSARQLLAAAIALRDTCRDSGLPLLINDRTDIARAAGCDGVHLGRDDLPVARARNMLGPDAIIGVTIRSALDIDNSDLADADYASIGAVFPTSSKADGDPPVGLAGLRQLLDQLRNRFPGPVIAISGIDVTNAGNVIAAGAEGIAVISAVWSAPDPVAALRELRSIVDLHSVKRSDP